MSDSQDETRVQPAAGADGRPRPGSAGQRSQNTGNQGPSGQSSTGPSSTGPSSTGRGSTSPATDNQGSSSQSASTRASGSGAAKKTTASGQQRPASSASSRSASTSSAATRSSGQGGGGSRTLTAADYARTTRGSADQTSVIPAIADAGSTSSATATTTATTTASGTGRQARLRLNHVEPWSVTRIAFVISVALMIVSTVAVAIFWIVLDVVGVWDQLNGSISNVLADDSGGFDLTDYLGLGRLTGLTLLLSAINVLVFTALATIGAHLYNLGAQLLGGIQVTFSDD